MKATSLKTASKRFILALTVTATTFASGTVFAQHQHHDHGSHGQARTSAASKQTYTTTGVVQSVEKASKRAVITHAPIPALSWPVMTMGFLFEEASLMDGLKAGDKVRFDFRNEGKEYIIVDIETN